MCFGFIRRSYRNSVYFGQINELSLNLLLSTLDDESTACWVIAFNRTLIQSKESLWFPLRSKMWRWTCRRCSISRYRKPAGPRSLCSFCKSLRLRKSKLIYIIKLYNYVAFLGTDVSGERTRCSIDTAALIDRKRTTKPFIETAAEIFSRSSKVSADRSLGEGEGIRSRDRSRKENLGE